MCVVVISHTPIPTLCPQKAKAPSALYGLDPTKTYGYDYYLSWWTILCLYYHNAFSYLDPAALVEPSI